MTLAKTLPVVRRLGALSLLVVGIVHLQEYTNGYAEIDTIGQLFMLNFAAATVIGVGLLLPIERLLPPRWGQVLVALLALGGAGLSATSLVMLWIAEHRPLFGFTEPGYHPDMIQLARISEAATILLLGTFLLVQLLGSTSDRRADTHENPTNKTQKETRT
jgi:hypothetical protein